MAYYAKPALRRRPVFIAEYKEGADKERESPPEANAAVATGGSEGGPGKLRYAFPPPGPVAEGGASDGYCFRIQFAAGRLERTYELIVAFLREQGYAQVPIPADANELRRFRLPPKLRHQLSLFGEDGYVHNPVKILFPKPAGSRGALVLELYDEAARGHLLKFHRR